jgi:predicted small secreted protein
MRDASGATVLDFISYPTVVNGLPMALHPVSVYFHYIISMSAITINQLKRIGLLGLVILVTTAVIGCNTMHGFGTDVEKAGEKIKKESD